MVMGVGGGETSGVNEAMEECEFVAQRLVTRLFVWVFVFLFGFVSWSCGEGRSCCQKVVSPPSERLREQWGFL